MSPSPPAVDAETRATKPPPSNLPAAMLLATCGLIAAIAAGVAIDRIHGPNGYFEFPEEISKKFPPMGQPIPAEILQLKDDTLKKLDSKNTALSLSLFGAIACGLFGLASGLLAKRMAGAVLGLVIGTALGAGCGGAAALADVYVFYALRAQDASPTIQAIVAHAAAWGVLAVGAGLSTGVASIRFKTCGQSVGAALLGGALAAALYVPLAGLLFVGDKSEVIAPTGLANRMFWLGLATTLMGLAMGLTRASRNSTQVQSEPAVSL